MAFAVEVEAQSISQQARLDGLAYDFDAGAANRKVLEDALARGKQLIGPHVPAAHSLWNTPRPPLRAPLKCRCRGARAVEAEKISKRVEE